MSVVGDNRKPILAISEIVHAFASAPSAALVLALVVLLLSGPNTWPPNVTVLSETDVPVFELVPLSVTSVRLRDTSD